MPQILPEHPATILKRERQELRGDLFTNTHAWRVSDDGTRCKWCNVERSNLTIGTWCA